MKLVNILTGELTEGLFQSTYIQLLDSQAEHPDPKSITETAYVPPQVQIEDMIDAGVRLAAYRKGRFDSIELAIDGDEIPLDPMREPAVDVVDTMKIGLAAADRVAKAKAKIGAEIKAQQAAADKAAFEEAVKKEVDKRTSQTPPLTGGVT